MNTLVAQIKVELALALRKGETLLLTIGIPVMFLCFFSAVSVVHSPTPKRVDFLFPGILALSVMSTAMVSLSISTGFERGYGVLVRLYMTPLGRGRLLAAKVVTIAVVEVLQVGVLGLTAVLLGYHFPSGTKLSGLVVVVALVILATLGFAGIGLITAGRLKPEVNLAAANGLYLVLLLISGMVIPLSSLGSFASVARLLPSTALAEGLHSVMSFGTPVGSSTWIVLILWAVLAPGLASRLFLFE
ncbi:MAG: ABC transporter permease [Actinomycetota bacterium]